MEKQIIEDVLKAGKIAQELRRYAREIIVKDRSLFEIATLIDDKISELGAKPAFPVNLSINEIAAHYTPSFGDEGVAHGLLKVDIGIHINGYIADTAFSVDLEGSEENKKLIEAAEAAVSVSVSEFEIDKKLTEIGKKIGEEISKFGFTSISNLSGHSIERFVVHAGWTVPNYDSGQTDILEEGLYATEPFATNGHGRVRDGGKSGIYRIDKDVSVRDRFAREVLGWIAEEYKTLPFASRWIHKKFGSRGLLAMKQLEQAGVLYQYPQLVEVSNGKVAQAEHTVLLLEDGTKFVTTRED
ncbi:type II methionyl aminopeptidase [Candidatus Pacearchaeota archaeon]|nr:type II methionyl aminopeptidase [Candidatus Pacearchaeota archaeon]